MKKGQKLPKVNSIGEKAGHQLSEEEIQLKTIIDASPVSIWYKDTKNNFIRVNKAAASIVGLTVEEIEGHSTDEVFPTESEKYYNDDLEVINSGKPKLGIIEPATTNGITTWVRTDKVPLFDTEGNITGIIAFALDVTDRVEAEEKLRSSETRYRKLFESAKDGILILNADNGQIVDVNPFMLQMIGYSHKELSEKKLWDIDVFRNIADSQKAFNELKGKGYFRFDDIVLKKKNGSEINVEFVINGFQVDHEKVILCNIHNISEQKQTEKALRESVQLFQGLFNASPDAIVLIDPHHPTISWPIIDCNEAVCLMNGYRREELIGQSIDILNTSVGNPEERIAYFENLKQHGTIRIEALHRHKDGHVIAVEVSTSIIMVDGRELVLGIDRDITDRKRAELLIQESEKHFHTIADSGQALIWTSGIDKKCDYFNQPWLNFTGRAIEQELGDGWAEGVHPDDLQRCIEIYTKAFDRRKKFSMDYRLRNANGEYRWIQDNGSPRYNSKDEFIGYIGHCLDITKRKRAEEETRIAEERFRMVFENVFDGIAIHQEDPDLAKRKLIECNEQYAAMAGIPREELLKIGYIQPLQIPFDATSNDDRIRSTITREAFKGTYSWVRPDGKENIIEYIGVPIIWNGNPYSIGIDRDITARKRAEKEIKTFSKAIEQGPSAIVITNADGKIEFANNKFTELTQYPLNEVKGKTPRIFNPGQLTDNEFQSLWETLRKGNNWKGEFINRRKDKSRYWEDVTISAVKNNDGTISNYILIINDITEKKQMLDDLIAAKEKAEEADRLKSAFLANMSHEIRTPLNSIIGFSDLLLDPFFGLEQHTEFANIIKDNGKNLLSILSDIMDLSKIEAGQVQIKKTKLSANQLITDLQKEFMFKATEKGIELKTDFPIQNEVIYLESDENKLKQILINFISNALKFTNEGFIEIGFRPNGDVIQFHVKDTGIGIPAKYHDTIFERFRQVETAFTRKYGGNGLGLPISKSLVELLGGNIWLESEQGKGSTFYFTIPA